MSKYNDLKFLKEIKSKTIRNCSHCQSQICKKDI